MKANELRIGNIVNVSSALREKYHFFSNDRAFEVIRITVDNSHPCSAGYYDVLLSKIGSDRRENSCTFSSWIEPIPLTAEILCDWCGFNKAKRCEGLTKHGIDLVAAGDAYYDNRTGRRITTLHQLQNFVFALTGDELNIKLPIVKQ